MRWFHSLFLRMFLGFWLILLVAVATGAATTWWLQTPNVREAHGREQGLLLRLIDRHPPILAEQRRLWQPLKAGWNLIAVDRRDMTHLPYDMERFVDQAIEQERVLWGHERGLVLIGPLVREDFVYLAANPRQWRLMFDDRALWLMPLMMGGVVTLLCFLLAWYVSRPIQRLQATLRQIAVGDFSLAAIAQDCQRRDDMGQLAREVTAMSHGLQRLLVSHQQLLRDVSHELRSPLTRLQIALGLARHKDIERNLVAEHARIERAAEQVNDLIADILDLARLQQDVGQINRSVESVSACLQRWCTEAELEMEAKSLRYRLSLPNDDVLAYWDWPLIQRAFDNILRNAIRFAPAESALAICVGLQSDRVEITIGDQGPGMPEALMARVFDPFFQVDPARDHASGGYGLGLSLVKRVVELHGGDITLMNTHPGLSVLLRIPRTMAE